MFWFTVVAIPVMIGSWWMSGWETPRKSDENYVREYRILNATKMSDKEILEERKDNEESKARWTISNKLLADEVINQGKEDLFKDWTLQKQLLQIQFHISYYENNITAQEFVWKMK